MNNSIHTTKNPNIDHLLAQIARTIQLSPADYTKAKMRYQKIIDWIEREDSPLSDSVEHVYPQGSMAIGTTIAAKDTIDEFDVDVAAELINIRNIDPKLILDLLYDAIKGKLNSPYYHRTIRRSRCITVRYEGKMHIDITPMVRRPNTQLRESWIFEDDLKDTSKPSRFIIANPFGFAEWFNQNTFDYNRSNLLLEADVEPVPKQIPMYSKSTAIVVLQLLKRWRNVQYSNRNRRQPPSIVLSKLVADNGPSTSKSLSCELLRHSKLILATVLKARGSFSIVNPVCTEDVLTDRWPASKGDQNLFTADLAILVKKLERLIALDYSDEESKNILTELFGETQTHSVIEGRSRSF